MTIDAVGARRATRLVWVEVEGDLSRALESRNQSRMEFRREVIEKAQEKLTLIVFDLNFDGV